MNKIRKLSDDLSNKIAAGEVVERPASVVKELVENALDAGSSRIQISLEEGGLSSIRVVDNGNGMEREDAELAFLRHATSKIKTENDLFRIASFGFRGEALPSIAAVSTLDLVTGTGKGPGTLIRYQGGKRIAFTSSKSRKGTDITVKNLFFNTPARLKYMKTINTEVGNLTDVINRLALAEPGVSFELSHNGRRLLFTNGNGDMRAVIAAIYGMNTARQFLQVKHSSLDYTIEGYAAKPETNRASRQYISTFINGRFVRHFPIVKAIERAYHTLLPIGRYPIVILKVTMDPVLVDVNVHPAKLEVRLSKEKELLEEIEYILKQTISSQPLIPNMDQKRAKKPQSEQLAFVLEKEKKQNDGGVKPTKPETPSYVKSKYQTPSMINETEDLLNEQSTYASIKENSAVQEKKHSVDRAPYEEDSDRTKPEQNGTVPEFEPIGQLHGTYILAQNHEGLYIIDQHAAQERIYYEFFRQKIGETPNQLQDLMVPVTMELSAREEQILEAHLEELEKVGVFLEPFGVRTYRIRSHPTWFPKGQEESTIRELLQQLLDAKKVNIAKLLEEAAILMSCKAAIKANRYLREDEMTVLIKDLRACVDPYTCPHGRPIIIHFSSYDMEKMFKRVM
ncbi:DNA mismatch repair endonuclease MutL [Alteribacillus sp. HJP-4]|uniref:DNA mismatch repair endonuclease MutL n=1 Tax=Alteribacillus sp. HJP-4 TaxID=2775394 RepID=UPI0035CCF504